jgi:hypothetical protein
MPVRMEVQQEVGRADTVLIPAQRVETDVLALISTSPVVSSWIVTVDFLFLFGIANHVLDFVKPSALAGAKPGAAQSSVLRDVTSGALPA